MSQLVQKTVPVFNKNELADNFNYYESLYNMSFVQILKVKRKWHWGFLGFSFEYTVIFRKND